MSKIRALLLVAIASTLLMGCHEDSSEAYFMSHPKALKRELALCQADHPDVDNPKCDLIAQAANKFMALVAEQQAGPERFGESILKNEKECVTAKLAFEKAQQDYDALRRNHAPAVSIEKAFVELNKNKKTYEDYTNLIKAMLAVVSLNSPD